MSGEIGRQSAKARRQRFLRPDQRGQPKLRYAPRLLRSLQRWSDHFAGYFPAAEEVLENPRYWNEKIPVYADLVEPPTTNAAIQRECAQRLIDACAHLMAAKPASLAHVRVTCCIVLPDMFGSELCLYIEDAYFRGHTTLGPREHGSATSLHPRSLAAEWGLHIPAGMDELGIAVDYPETEGYYGWSSELWYFGEVGDADRV